MVTSFVGGSFAQTIQGSTSNLCPGQKYTYSFSTSAYCSNTNWSVSGGTPSNERRVNGVSSIDVVWFNVASGTVSVNPSGNVGGTCPNQATSQNVTIRNLTAPTISGSNPRFVACGNQQITISASSVTNANSYKWTLPAGIVPASGTTTTTTPSITVNLTENASGEIRVRAHDGSCSYDGPNSGALVITRKGATPLLTWTWTEKEIC